MSEILVEYSSQRLPENSERIDVRTQYLNAFDQASAKVRNILQLASMESIRAEQLLDEKTPRDTKLVVGGGPGITKVVTGLVQRGYGVDVVFDLPLGGRLHNVEAEKPHLQKGLGELMSALSHKNVRVLSGIKVGLTDNDPGDIRLTDLVRGGKYTGVFLSVGTIERQVTLLDGKNIGEFKGHEYGYSLTQRAYEWVRSGKPLGEMPLDNNEHGNEYDVFGAGYVALEDTARILMALQIGKALKRLGIEEPHKLAGNPRKALAELHAAQTPDGQKFRDLMQGSIDFAKEMDPVAERNVLVEKLGIKPVRPIYYKSKDEYLKKNNPGTLKAFQKAGFYELEFNREPGLVTEIDGRIAKVQLIKGIYEGRKRVSHEMRETVRPAMWISALGGDRPEVRVGKDNIKIQVIEKEFDGSTDRARVIPQEIDGVFYTFSGNATYQGGNKAVSEKDGAARLEDMLMVDPVPRIPTSEEWKDRNQFISSLQRAFSTAANAEGDFVKAALQSVPVHTLEQWNWWPEKDEKGLDASLQNGQEVTPLQSDLVKVFTIIPELLEQIQNGTMSVVEIKDGISGNTKAFEFMYHVREHGQITEITSLGLRVTQEGLEYRFLASREWKLVYSEATIQGPIFNGSRGTIRVELDETAVRKILDLKEPPVWVNPLADITPITRLSDAEAIAQGELFQAIYSSTGESYVTLTKRSIYDGKTLVGYELFRKLGAHGKQKYMTVLIDGTVTWQLQHQNIDVSAIRTHMDQARSRIARGLALGSIYGDKTEMTREKAEMIIRLSEQLEVSSSGVISTKGEKNPVSSDKQLQSLLRQMRLKEGLEIPDDYKEFDARERRIDFAINSAAVVAGIAVSASFNKLVSMPNVLGFISAMVAPSLASLSDSMDKAQGAYARHTPEYKKARTKRRLSGAAGWFLAALAFETLGEAMTHTNPIDAFSHHVGSSGTIFEASPIATTNPVAHASGSPVTHPPAPVYHAPVTVPEVVIHPVAPEVTSTPPSASGVPYNANIYVNEWRQPMQDAVTLIGNGTEGWANTVDHNGVTQARLMSHWNLLLSGKIPDSELQSILKQIGQTHSLSDYQAIREDLLAQVNAALQ